MPNDAARSDDPLVYASQVLQWPQKGYEAAVHWSVLKELLFLPDDTELPEWVTPIAESREL